MMDWTKQMEEMTQNMTKGWTDVQKQMVDAQKQMWSSFSGAADNTQILGNYFGVSATGDAYVANSVHGVWFGDSTGTIIGGVGGAGSES